MTTEHLRVRAGEPFTVALPEPPATGHRWQLVEGPAEVVLLDERYEAPAPGGPRGTSGTSVLRLRAELPGRHLLTFALLRPPSPAPARRHQVEVEAVAGAGPGHRG